MALPRNVLIAGGATTAVVILVIVVLFSRSSSSTQSPTALPAPQPVAGSPSSHPATVPGGDAATLPQLRLVAMLARKRGWNDAERDTQTERVLGYKRKETELNKQEASKLIEVWDDRKK